MMPANVESQPAAKDKGSSTTFLHKKAKRVLVIDDTEEIRMIISESLNIYGFDTLSAENGEAGIDVAREHLPDLIICDINMPRMDGYETLKAIRQHEPTSTIPFIFLSGATERPNVRKGMELGADDYLTKPFSHKELMAAVNTRLEKQAELQRQSDKKLDELRGNITMALPHELRTPLNGIVGLANILIEDHGKLPPEEVLESAKYIHESAMRLHRLIENFLVFSQIELMGSESKRIEISDTTAPIAVDRFVSDIARNVASRYKREADLVIDLQEATLLIPEDNFRKIVEELIDNAFKFSEAGKPVMIATEMKDHQFRLMISDQGRGMTTEQIAKIAPHTQFERKTFEQQGAGLGLIISKRLTELLGGDMRIESKPGQETSIIVSFLMPGH
ncbi:MAG TPA: hybrid sensor histidine kinase/response regulator [Candidatus Saccharimonadales bacterium]|nr:hybrid sensor histidine kinase/response regulator [Candidatus Saccharimonadales bacterium]